MAAAVDLAGIPLRDLEALFFDAGNTLVGIDVALVAERLGARGIQATAAQVGRAEAAARPAVSRRLEGGVSSEARDTFAFYLRRALDHLGAATGGRTSSELDAIADGLAVELKTEVPTRRLWSRVLPGVPGALAALRSAGLRLVVVSNSDGTIARGLDEAGIGDLLDGVIDSAVVRIEKPDPRIFRFALERSGSAPERTAHVGDLHAVDVLGARAAGLHGVLLDPHGDWVDFDCPKVPDVATLADAIFAARRGA
jgi:putative hydrolase of the HAD superfamily